MIPKFKKSKKRIPIMSCDLFPLGANKNFGLQSTPLTLAFCVHFSLSPGLCTSEFIAVLNFSTCAFKGSCRFLFLLCI